MDHRGFNGFRKGQRRQNARHSFCEHTLAAAGRPDQQGIVSAGGCKLQRVLCGGLPVYIGKIGNRRRIDLLQPDMLHRCQRRIAFQMCQQRFCIRHAVNGHILDDGGLFCICQRHIHCLDAALSCGQRHREHAVDRSDIAVERDFSDDCGIRRDFNSAECRKNRHKDRKIVHTAVFAAVCRCEIDDAV